MRTPGTRAEKRLETDEEKRAFFERYGFKRDMFGAHPEVVEYSKQRYEAKSSGE